MDSAKDRTNAEGLKEGIVCMPMDGSDRWIVAGERIDGWMERVDD